jgi:hypothetical protein
LLQGLACATWVIAIPAVKQLPPAAATRCAQDSGEQEEGVSSYQLIQRQIVVGTIQVAQGRKPAAMMKDKSKEKQVPRAGYLNRCEVDSVWLRVDPARDNNVIPEAILAMIFSVRGAHNYCRSHRAAVCTSPPARRFRKDLLMAFRTGRYMQTADDLVVIDQRRHIAPPSASQVRVEAHKPVQVHGIAKS